MIDLRSNPAVGLMIAADRRSDFERQAAEHRLWRDSQPTSTSIWSRLAHIRVRRGRPAFVATVLRPSPG